MRKHIEYMSIPDTCSIRQAMQAIERGEMGIALLAEPGNERFVGLVTDGDIRRALLNGYGLDSPVATVPRPQSKTASVSMPLSKIAEFFSKEVRVVPLLDETGRVVDLAVFDRRMNVSVAEPYFDEKELLYVSECVLLGWVSSAGKFINRFEEKFAEFCGTGYAIATCNGTTALHLSLLALGIGLGDEVIVPTLSFIATANAVTYTGAQPVFVDSEPETWNISPGLIKDAITPRTKAIIAVHLYGHPANMDPILEIAGRYGLKVVEDAAEAHGARYKGRRVGGIGDAGIFSFYGNKIITTGEGGMIVTNQAELAEKMRILRSHGMSEKRRYWHPMLGYNYRMTNIQAALGVAQLEKIEKILATKQRMAQTYNEALAGVPGLTLPPKASWADSVYWLYSILVEKKLFGMERDAMITALKEQGVDTRPLFIPIHTQPIYATGQSLPVAQRLAEQGLSLPSAARLGIPQIQYIAKAIVSLRTKT